MSLFGRLFKKKTRKGLESLEGLESQDKPAYVRKLENKVGHLFEICRLNSCSSPFEIVRLVYPPHSKESIYVGDPNSQDHQVLVHWSEIVYMIDEEGNVIYRKEIEERDRKVK